MSSQFCQTRYSSVRRAFNASHRQIFFLSLIFFFTAASHAFAGEKSADDGDFFSYKTYYLNEGVPPQLGDKEKLNQEIEKFRRYFTDGMNALSSGDMPGARKALLAARATWPEYLNTDLLIALSYENDGDIEEAAKFYKSYLNKLKDYHKGRYRISAPMINSFSLAEVAEYAKAYEFIKARVALHDIDIDKVRSAVVLPASLVPSIVTAVIICAYLPLRYFLSPYMRKRRRIKYPPEGFWVCKKCVTDNTLLDKECGKCGSPPAKRENIPSERRGAI